MPKIVDHDERRSAIAAAAATVIADEGVEGTTLKVIACRAGVTTGAVTHYFADKEQVMLAALHHADAALHDRVEAALARRSSPVATLLGALPNDEASRREWLVWRAFGDAAIRSEALRSQYRRSMARWLDAATETIADRTSRPPGEARLDAELVVAVVDAIADATSIDPESWPIERQRAVLEHCLARVFPS